MKKHVKKQKNIVSVLQIYLFRLVNDRKIGRFSFLEYFVKMRFIIEMFGFACVLVLANSLVTVEDEQFLEADSMNKGHCSEDITSNGSGSFSLLHVPGCLTGYYITIHSMENDSILNLTIQYVSNYENSSSNESEINREFENVRVSIYEKSQKLPKEYILLENWKLQNTSSLTEQSYLTLTSEARIRITGNWSNYDILFLYREYKYELIEQDFQTVKEIKTEEGQYRPNCVSLYRVSQVKNKNVSSIEIILHFLDIDITVGEYLLMGEGKDAFTGAPPLFITKSEPNTIYYVNGVSAYIAFVSSSRRSQRRGFKISWKYTSTKVFDIDETPDDVLDKLYSMPICFYNASTEPEKHKNLYDEILEEFRERFVETANNYTTEKTKEKRYKSLSASSVLIFEPLRELSQQKGISQRNPTLYVLVKDLSTGKPAFKWKELGEVIDRFESTTKEIPVYGYKVGKCPKGFAYTQMWSLLIYASVPTFGFFYLMIWAWKQKTFKQACIFPDEEKKISKLLSQTKSVEQNVYENTIPKIVLENDRGRRHTLNQRNSFQINEDERDCDTDLIAVASTDEEFINPRYHISYGQSKRRPSIQSLLLENDDSGQQSCAGKTEENEEHLYDSVAHDKEMQETRL